MSIFTAEKRDTLFSSISPDIQSIIDNLESHEDWTFLLGEHPEVYGEISEVIRASSSLEGEGAMGTSQRDTYLGNILIALSSISFSYCIIGLAFLDKKKMQDKRSLSEAIVDHAFLLRDSDPGSAYVKEARVVADRVTLFIDSGIVVKMFSGLMR